ncbi:MAG: restriction endonuclease, partial [Chlorobia bacterium]|nr:restriction endonuclease [Fimbriimonadaceae bacterium]
VDAIEVVLKSTRIFIGYPMHSGTEYNPRGLRSCIVDPSCSDDDWLVAHASSSKRSQFNQNRNLIRKVTPGSIAVVPRPSSGLVYCGLVKGPFEIVDSPLWYESYLEIRAKQGRAEVDGDSWWHAGDISQGWEVDEWREIPYSKIPAWIRRSFFGRSTYGVVGKNELGQDPHEAMLRILHQAGRAVRSWSLSPDIAEERMLEDLSPTSFEHLVVSLLQLEYPAEVWSHVGGSGDGGVDGIGSTDQGDLIGLLQCKWHYHGGDCFADDVRVRHDDLRLYLATLQTNTRIGTLRNLVHWDRSRIAKLVLKHHDRLPQAMSMRIGTAS